MKMVLSQRQREELYVSNWFVFDHSKIRCARNWLSRCFHVFFFFFSAEIRRLLIIWVQTIIPMHWNRFAKRPIWMQRNRLRLNTVVYWKRNGRQWFAYRRKWWSSRQSCPRCRKRQAKVAQLKLNVARANGSQDHLKNSHSTDTELQLHEWVTSDNKTPLSSTTPRSIWSIFFDCFRSALGNISSTV